MLQDRERSFDEFIKITAGGVDVADYDQIQAALIKRYKEVYGEDINLANTTADGIFINDLSLIINNILRSFEILYSNLNVETANGTYLDTLCKLSNVSRLQSTASTAELQITTTVNNTLSKGTIFIDTTGNEWTYNGETILIDANASQATTITVTCNELGPIVAPAGSITQTLEASTFKVVQEKAANVGRNDETDAHLRARRAQSTGATGTTVLESLAGALLTLDGVDDVQIINNVSKDNYVASDGTPVPLHNIYAILRYNDNVKVDDTKVANIIYDKLTPGISSTAFGTTAKAGTGHSFEVSLNNEVDFLKQTINWKEATPIAPQMSIKISRTLFYAGDTTTKQIADAVISYLNSIKLSQMPMKNDIIIAATYAGDTFKAQPTYVVTDVTLPSFASYNNVNPNTYFKYTTYTDDSATSVDDTLTITIS